MTSSTLEKVARAIIRARHATCCKDRDFSTFVLSPLDLDLAKAALQSLRQVDALTLREMALAFRMDRSPTEAMGDAFTAAIDHILGETGRAEVER